MVGMATGPAVAARLNIELTGDWGPFPTQMQRLAICSANDSHTNGKHGADNGGDCKSSDPKWDTWNPDNEWRFEAVKMTPAANNECPSKHDSPTYIKCWHVQGPSQTVTFTVAEDNVNKFSVYWYVTDNA